MPVPEVNEDMSVQEAHADRIRNARDLLGGIVCERLSGEGVRAGRESLQTMMQV